MFFRAAGLLIGGCLLFNCSGGRKPSRGEGFAFFKNPESNEACLNSNMSQWELSGEFLHGMLSCASNRSRDGEETLPATRNLLKELSPEKLQRLIEFALLPDKTAGTHEERYPYLLALASVLDRGMTAGEKEGLNLATERLEQLQPFLLSLDPSRMQKQLSIWSESGRLNDLLAELGLVLQSLEDDTLAAVSHELLQSGSVARRLMRVSTTLLSQDPLMDSLDAALSGSRLQEPDALTQTHMVNTWRQPQSPDASDHPPAVKVTGLTETGLARHLDEFSQTLRDDEIQKLSAFLVSFWNAYRSLDAGERAFISRRLAVSLEAGLDQQKNLVRWLLAIAHDLSRMPASDLNPISETLERLLDPSVDPTLDTLRAKLWSSRMMEKLLELLTEGGAIPGCTALTIPGLKTVDGGDFAPVYEILRTMNMPQTACQGRTPFNAALESWAQVAVGRSCDSADCLELSARVNEPELMASYWNEAYVEPDSRLWRELLLQTLQESRLQLQRDRYYWKNIGVAHRAVAPEMVDHLLDRLRNSNPQTLRELAQWEQELMQDGGLQGVLSADPMEKLLSIELERLSGVSQQFHELIPRDLQSENKAINQRAARVFAGVYTQGPLEQALRYKLPATLEGSDDILQDPGFHWPEEIQQTFAADRSLFSHFLFRFKQADGIFRNPELGSLVDGADVAMAGLGSPGRYLGFERLDHVSIQPRVDTRLIQPLQAVRSAAADPAGWGLWRQQLTSSGLTAKDLPPERTTVFQEFSERFAETIGADARWADLQAAEEPLWSRTAPAIHTEFFDIEPYSVAEARMLALYHMRHYHRIAPAFPVEAEPGHLPAGGLRGFFSAAAMVTKMDADYTLFARLFPARLGSAVSSLEALSREVLTQNPDGTQLFSPIKVSPVTRVGLLPNQNAALLANPNFQLLSTFNLLGLTKAGSAYYIQPLIGLDDKSCAAADGSPAPCAVELRGTDIRMRLSQYQKFIAGLIAKSYCPLLTTDEFGAREEWVRRLQLKPDAAGTCQNQELVEVRGGDESRFPAWLTRRILHDVFSMGRKARLKKGLAHIPAALRFYKLAREELSSTERARLWLRQARGQWNALNAATQSRRQYYAVQFWAGQPSLLNGAVAQWQQGIESTSWTDFLARLAQRNDEGASQDVVHEFLALVIRTQQESAQSGSSLLGMGLTLMERISTRPELLEAAGHILGNFTSAENYDFAGRDLPFAMTLFSRFNWNDPGLRFSKFLAQKETIQLWVQFSEYFSPAEWGRFLNQVQTSGRVLGQGPGRADLLQRFLKEGVALGTLMENEAGDTLSDRWNMVLQAWRRTDFGKTFRGDWESLLTVLDQPLQTLDGRATRSMAGILELWLPHVLKHGAGLLRRHQEAGGSPETSFWSKTTLDLFQSIEAEPSGSQAFARFLSDPRLGLVKSDLWVRALTNADSRRTLADALVGLSSISKPLWREALVESSELLGRLGKALGYMKRRMVWKEDPDHNAYRIVIDQLYALSHDVALRGRQIEVLKLWFRNREDEEMAAGFWNQQD